MKYRYQLVDTSEFQGSDVEKVGQMQAMADQMGNDHYRWVRTDGPLMVFEHGDA